TPLQVGENARKITLETGCTVRGVVVDAATRKPLAGARVAYASQTTAFTGVFETATTSDAEGSFVVSHVPAEPGMLLGSAKGFRQNELLDAETWKAVMAVTRGASAAAT